jgi:hypothetical protein
LFREKFGVDHKDFKALMKNWLVDEECMVKKGERYIYAHHLKDPYIILNAMIYRLYGEETNTHFRMEWFYDGLYNSQDYEIFQLGQHPIIQYINSSLGG